MIICLNMCKEYQKADTRTQKNSYWWLNGEDGLSIDCDDGYYHLLLN